MQDQGNYPGFVQEQGENKQWQWEIIFYYRYYNVLQHKILGYYMRMLQGIMIYKLMVTYTWFNKLLWWHFDILLLSIIISIMIFFYIIVLPNK